MCSSVRGGAGPGGVGQGEALCDELVCITRHPGTNQWILVVPCFNHLLSGVFSTVRGGGAGPGGVGQGEALICAASQISGLSPYPWATWHGIYPFGYSRITPQHLKSPRYLIHVWPGVPLPWTIHNNRSCQAQIMRV
jgi:hypothetical protein